MYTRPERIVDIPAQSAGRLVDFEHYSLTGQGLSLSPSVRDEGFTRDRPSAMICYELFDVLAYTPLAGAD